MKDAAGFQWTTENPDYPKHYEELNRKYHSLYSVSAAELAKLAGAREGMTALDVGCGTGISTDVIRSIVGEQGRVIGIDANAAMLTVARERFRNQSNIVLIEANVFDLSEQDIPTDTADVALANFCYYYLKERREELHARVMKILKEGGTWVYNSTPYLTQTELHEKRYNTYASMFRTALDTVLQEQGYPGVGRSLKESYPPMEEERKALRSAGFTEIRIDPFALPLKPHEAYQFTLEGFWSHGAIPSESETLCQLDVPTRVKLLQAAIDRSAAEMDATGPVTIFNIRGVKETSN